MPTPPTVDDLLEVVRRATPDWYSDAMLHPRNVAFLAGVAQMWAALARDIARRQQARYVLPYARQSFEPSSFASPATFTANITNGESLGVAYEVAAGAMRLEGPNGRLYANRDAHRWRKHDAVRTREVVFECLAPGFFGNLDFLDIVGGDNVPAETYEFVDLSRGRGNDGATVVQTGTTLSLRDNGQPEVFSADDINLYVRIDDAAVSENVGRLMRVVAHRPLPEEPPNSNIFPSLVSPQALPIPDRWKAVHTFFGGVFTNVTAAANEADANETALLPPVPVVNDTVYFGHPVHEGTRIEITITTAGEGEWTIVWERWDGNAWVPLADVSDPTQGFRSEPGTYAVEYQLDVPPSQEITINGVAAYYVRARVDAFVSLTTQPVMLFAEAFVWQPLEEELTPTIKWQIRDWKDLGFTIALDDAGNQRGRCCRRTR